MICGIFIFNARLIVTLFTAFVFSFAVFLIYYLQLEYFLH